LKNIKEWENRDPEDHAVYIIGRVFGGEVTGPSKIGVSKQPKARLGTLEGEIDAHLVLVAVFWFWKRRHAFAVENAFHRACAGCRIRGEWFDMEPFHAVGVMSANLNEFADKILGADDTHDYYSVRDHLNVPGFMHLAEVETFGHRQ